MAWNTQIPAVIQSMIEPYKKSIISANVNKSVNLTLICLFSKTIQNGGAMRDD